MKLIPYAKLSKRARMKIDKKRRRSWGPLNPVTSKPKNPKAYNRNRTKKVNDEI